MAENEDRLDVGRFAEDVFLGIHADREAFQNMLTAEKSGDKVGATQWRERAREVSRPLYLTIVKAASAVANKYYPIKDRDALIGAAIYEVLLARERYDPSRGTKFLTFVYPRIWGAVIDEAERLGHGSIEFIGDVISDMPRPSTDPCPSLSYARSELWRVVSEAGLTRNELTTIVLMYMDSMSMEDIGLSTKLFGPAGNVSASRVMRPSPWLSQREIMLAHNIDENEFSDRLQGGLIEQSKHLGSDSYTGTGVDESRQNPSRRGLVPLYRLSAVPVVASKSYVSRLHSSALKKLSKSSALLELSELLFAGTAEHDVVGFGGMSPELSGRSLLTGRRIGGRTSSGCDLDFSLHSIGPLMYDIDVMRRRPNLYAWLAAGAAAAIGIALLSTRKP